MFASPPNQHNHGDLEPLAEAIEGLCAILDGDREAVIEGLAEILRKRIVFETLKRSPAYRHYSLNDPRL